MNKAGEEPFFVMLCAHGPRCGTELTNLKDEPGRFPTELVAERLREQLEFQPADGGTPPKLRGIFYAATPEAAQTAALLLGGIAAPRATQVPPYQLADIRSACDRRMGPLETSAEVVGVERYAKPTCERSTSRPARAIGTGEPSATATGSLHNANFCIRHVVEENPLTVTIPVRPCALLLQKNFQAGADRELGERLLAAAREKQTRLFCDTKQGCCMGGPALPDGNAVLVVGHRPQLSWLAGEMLRGHRRWPPRFTAGAPFSLGEIVCLHFTPQRHPSSRILWTISPDDKSAADKIRDKIKSKMETAKLLGGLISLLIAALLGVLLDQGKLKDLAKAKWTVIPAGTAIGVSAVLLFLALILFVATYYSYDRLLMPSRFWVERRPPRDDSRRGSVSVRRQRWLVRRPPSSEAWVLYANMMRVWWWLFTPATVFGGLALAVPAVVLIRPQWWEFLLILVSVILTFGWWIWFRPVLGSAD